MAGAFSAGFHSQGKISQGGGSVVGVWVTEGVGVSDGKGVSVGVAVTVSVGSGVAVGVRVGWAVGTVGGALVGTSVAVSVGGGVGTAAVTVGSTRLFVACTTACGVGSTPSEPQATVNKIKLIPTTHRRSQQSPMRIAPLIPFSN